MGEPTDGEKARRDEGVVPRDLPGRILNNLLEGVQVVGRDYRYLYVNEAVVAQGRTTRKELLGRTMMECYPGIDRMPTLGGQRLAEQIQGLHPEVKVLFMSGHTDNAVVHQEVLDASAAFIGKHAVS